MHTLMSLTSTTAYQPDDYLEDDIDHLRERSRHENRNDNQSHDPWDEVDEIITPDDDTEDETTTPALEDENTHSDVDQTLDTVKSHRYRVENLSADLKDLFDLYEYYDVRSDYLLQKSNRKESRMLHERERYERKKKSTIGKNTKRKGQYRSWQNDRSSAA